MDSSDIWRTVQSFKIGIYITIKFVQKKSIEIARAIASKAPAPKFSLKPFNFSLYRIISMGIQLTIFGLKYILFGNPYNFPEQYIELTLT
jgi:hypothetical protein